MPNQFPFDPTPEVTFGDVLNSGQSIAEQNAAVEDAWLVLSTGVLNTWAQFALLNITYLGAGRFVGPVIDSALEPSAGTGLTVLLPNATYLIEGRVVVVANPEPTPYEVVAGILANKLAGVEVFVGLDDDTGLPVTLPEWQFDTYPTAALDLATVAGLLHIGRVTTDATSVTAIAPSTVNNAGIIRPPGSGSGGGGGGGDVTTAQLDAAIAALTASFNARIAALQALIVPGVQPKMQPLEQTIGELQLTRAGLLDVEVELFGKARTDLRSQSASIGRLRGSGEFSGADYERDTDMVKQDDGSYSPAP